MGCITGFVAKIFLTAFNIFVTLTGAAVLALAAIVAVYLNKFDDLIPKEIHQILDGLQSVSPLVMALGLFGVLVSCCCSNKLFLYTYFILGCCLVVATLTVSGIGTSNINNGHYEEQIKNLMQQDLEAYNLDKPGLNETSRDVIYSENKCCGVMSYTDWSDQNNDTKKLPAGCCTDFPTATACSTDGEPGTFYSEGCYTKLEKDVGDIAQAAVKLGVFFGVLLFALLTSTCLCVKCTDAMPI